MPAMPIADSRPPIVVGIRQTSSATSTIDALLGAGVDGERLQRHDGEQEDDRQPGEQDRQGDLVRGLLPVGALDERDHAVEERLARLGGDLHDDLVAQHPGAAGDRRAVAARLADDRRRLAGDRRLVDRGDALDDVAVAGDHLAGGDDAQVAELRAATTAFSTIVPSARPHPGRRLGAGLAQRVGLRLAAALGHRLGEVGEQHREPQPQRRRDRRTRSPGRSLSPKSRMNSIVVSTEPTSTMNITGLRHIVRGFELARTASIDAEPTIAGSKIDFDRRLACVRTFGGRWAWTGVGVRVAVMVVSSASTGVRGWGPAPAPGRTSGRRR